MATRSTVADSTARASGRRNTPVYLPARPFVAKRFANCAWNPEKSRIADRNAYNPIVGVNFRPLSILERGGRKVQKENGGKSLSAGKDPDVPLKRDDTPIGELPGQ
jgi:hypothetical protein